MGVCIRLKHLHAHQCRCSKAHLEMTCLRWASRWNWKVSTIADSVVEWSADSTKLNTAVGRQAPNRPVRPRREAKEGKERIPNLQLGGCAGLKTGCRCSD